MLDESICHFRGVGSISFILFLMKILVSKQCRPDQTPHYVVSDLGLYCYPLTLILFQVHMGKCDLRMCMGEDCNAQCVQN